MRVQNPILTQSSRVQNPIFTQSSDDDGESVQHPEEQVDERAEELNVAKRVAAYESKRIVEPVFRPVTDDSPAKDGEDHRQAHISLPAAIAANFMGAAPVPYKVLICAIMVFNAVLRFGVGKQTAAWAVLIEFLATLALSPYHLPLQSGGLIMVQAFLLQLVTTDTFQRQVVVNLNVLLLVAFMVASIHYLKNLLLWLFTNILVRFESKIGLSVATMVVTALLSGFLDALSVIAVLVSVCTGVLGVYYHVVENADLPLLPEHLYHDTMSYELVPHVASRPQSSNVTEQHVTEMMQQCVTATETRRTSASDDDNLEHSRSSQSDERSLSRSPDGRSPDGQATAILHGSISEAKAYGLHKDDIMEFRRFLKSLLMHGTIGTAMGGCATMVGEPQNMLIAQHLQMQFKDFFLFVLPISTIVWVLGIMVCIIVEATGRLGYGAKMPSHVRLVLSEFVREEYGKIHTSEAAELAVQGVALLGLVVTLWVLAPGIWFVGLATIIIVTTFNGITEEHEISESFLETMPFVSLLVVFFAAASMILDQHLFDPIIEILSGLDESLQPAFLFVVDGLLSMFSDNIFIATIFIEAVGDKQGLSNEVNADNGTQTLFWSEQHFHRLGMAISLGTNLPSIATPNGHATALFLMTSAIAPLVELTYSRMVLMAAPYAIAFSVAGLVGVTFMV